MLYANLKHSTDIKMMLIQGNMWFKFIRTVNMCHRILHYIIQTIISSVWDIDWCALRSGVWEEISMVCCNKSIFR